MTLEATPDVEYDDIPLQHQRPFGSGLRCKHITFVPASSGKLVSPDQSTSSAQSRSVADLYLDIVLPEDTRSQKTETALAQVCEVCQLPLNEVPSNAAQNKPHQRHHETSIAHQVCITHSHPPSSIDRSRMGLAVLSARGWDPDSRTGLGATQQGIQFPIKATPKDDKLGIGVKVPKNLEVKKKEKPKTLDAGKVRKMAKEDKKRREKLQRQFYGNSDIEKYLGSG